MNAVTIYDHYTLHSYLQELRAVRGLTFKDISTQVGITPQAVGNIFNGEDRLAINHLSGWKKALRFKRLEGMYFELLASLAAFPTSSERERLRERVLLLIGHLIAHSELNADAPRTLIYWLSPECTLLRNLVDLADFPCSGAEVPDYVVQRFRAYRVARSLSEREQRERLVEAWDWLLAQGFIRQDAATARFYKCEPVFAASKGLDKHLPDPLTNLLAIPHADGLRELASQVGTPLVLTSQFATLPMPRGLEPFLVEWLAQHMADLVNNLNIAVNSDELARLATQDPARYEAALAFRKELTARGFAPPNFRDSDFNSLIQVAIGIRRLND